MKAPEWTRSGHFVKHTIRLEVSGTNKTNTAPKSSLANGQASVIFLRVFSGKHLWMCSEDVSRYSSFGCYLVSLP